jgi:hypothetical protein
MDFLDIARVIAGPLAEQRFLPSKDPARTRLMIMVYWGTTDVPEPITTTAAYQFYKSSLEEYNALKSVDQSAADAALSAGLAELNFENNRRDKIDFKNAEMIGYDSDGAGLIGTDRGSILQFTALRHERDGLVPEIEENRYFVVLMAYDFQMMWKEKKHKLLWETRFSINQPRNDFGKALPAMAKFASSYFGQASHGLVRQEIPEGHVEVGAPTLVEWLFPTKK